MRNPGEVIDFWLNDVGPVGWYAGGEDLDATIREKFLTTWQAAKAGKLKSWTYHHDSTLALLILLDQFSRNIFRGSSDAFSVDSMARKIAKKAIEQKWDLRVPEPQRQFFYLPLMHSECLSDQERCVCLMMTRMPETGKSNLIHAKAHREVIRKFGRFPFRNEALSRSGTEPEMAFLASGGYKTTVAAVSAH
ncbi:DUF924 family protein [Cochlodiniinecator piscidefendens]|uniref:DUF924 family protein n=1 Tax=Cochlodiniinecator piscidefendens TaxID=2715756 RepID=UPI00140B502B|nr:DUF924 family protein [Cochlodiniinecator piscidefendens]